ncbi:MAG: acetolactate synthase large subunit [Halopseudomonas sp.]
MNGAQALLHTLKANGVDICFANPGTSEMHLVQAIGHTDGVRAVLCLYEGVVTGAADGYARMTDKPAATLLHLGSGFSNSMANQHNARRAGVPLVNIVGDHATYHLQYDAPLTSDLQGHAMLSSAWVGIAASADELSAKGAEAVSQAYANGGQISTLIAPADCSWDAAGTPAGAITPQPAASVDSRRVTEVAGLLGNGKRTAVFLGGRALRSDALEAAGRIAAATGAVLICETFPARQQRGAGRVPVQRLPYFAEQAQAFLQSFEQMILVDSKAPVAFFAYPGKASWLAPDNCTLVTLAEHRHAVLQALSALASELDAPAEPTSRQAPMLLPIKTGVLNMDTLGRSIGALMPENAIVSDEGVTTSLGIYLLTQGAKPHDWLTLTGGAIGQGLPVALGAALACSDRKVIALQADGSAMYTNQALWSMVREQVDVTVILLNNSSYAILNVELARVGAGEPNAKTLSMLDLSNPALDWTSIARGMGMQADRATSADEFHQLFEAAMQQRGPRLIEAIIAPISL